MFLHGWYFRAKFHYYIYNYVPSEADPFTDLDDSVDNSDADDELIHLVSAVQGSDGACT